MEEGTPRGLLPRTPEKNTGANDAHPESPNSRKYRVLFEDMRSRFNELRKSTNEQTIAHEKLVAEKDDTIRQLEARADKPCVMKMNNDDAFVSKQRKGATGPTKRCGMQGCDMNDVDLIRCSLCGTLVCEECSGAKVTKLRPLMSQCKTLYFSCHVCNEQINNKTTLNAFDVLKQKTEALAENLQSCEAEKDMLAQTIKTLEEQHVSLNHLLAERETSLHETETKLVTLEQSSSAVPKEPSLCSNFEEMITKRLDIFDKRVDELIEKKIAGVLQIPSTAGLNSGEPRKSFADAVGGISPTPTTRISDLKTSRNAELVEKQEQDKRMNNIIIHGISEVGAGDNAKEFDNNFIKSFLEVIEVDVAPKQILRIGNKTPDKKRPVKVILKNSDDKSTIMSNLNKLKNANEDVRGISVRDDYTQEERKLIQAMHEEAKRKNEEDNVTHWKVRGTPKNGLRVVKITARN